MCAWRALFLFLLWMLCRAMEHVCSNGIPVVRKYDRGEDGKSEAMLCRAMEHVCSNSMPFVRKNVGRAQLKSTGRWALQLDGLLFWEDGSVQPPPRVLKQWLDDLVNDPRGQGGALRPKIFLVLHQKSPLGREPVRFDERNDEDQPRHGDQEPVAELL